MEWCSKMITTTLRHNQHKNDPIIVTDAGGWARIDDIAKANNCDPRLIAYCVIYDEKIRFQMAGVFAEHEPAERSRMVPLEYLFVRATASHSKTGAPEAGGITPGPKFLNKRIYINVTPELRPYITQMTHGVRCDFMDSIFKMGLLAGGLSGRHLSMFSICDPKKATKEERSVLEIDDDSGKGNYAVAGSRHKTQGHLFFDYDEVTGTFGHEVWFSIAGALVTPDNLSPFKIKSAVFGASEKSRETVFDLRQAMYQPDWRESKRKANTKKQTELTEPGEATITTTIGRYQLLPRSEVSPPARVKGQRCQECRRTTIWQYGDKCRDRTSGQMEHGSYANTKTGRKECAITSSGRDAISVQNAQSQSSTHSSSDQTQITGTTTWLDEESTPRRWSGHSL
jgi:RNA:NAD 2'-phosphotransferase (TPT1/KptA family)